ncbi:unnamed protein product [Nezara viridula]|uniref:Uncharacterized protein n=1 Tax=Nezara viridula TaxID=85310 RepID=A0A9P0HFB4_NEZVI|nr:unnamed protein product [Nezara viridula]
MMVALAPQLTKSVAEWDTVGVGNIAIIIDRTIPRQGRGKNVSGLEIPPKNKKKLSIFRMPVPPSKSPFLKEQHLFQCSLSRNKLKNEERKEFEYIPKNSITAIEFPNYSPLKEVEFYKLISEEREAVVNFSEGDGYISDTFHTYLKILSYEHDEAEFYYLDTASNDNIKKKLCIRTNPTLVVIIENEVRDVISGFEDFKSKSVVNLPALKARLASSGVIRYGGIIPEKPQDIDDEYVRTARPLAHPQQEQAPEEEENGCGSGSGEENTASRGLLIQGVVYPGSGQRSVCPPDHPGRGGMSPLPTSATSNGSSSELPVGASSSRYLFVPLLI